VGKASEERRFRRTEARMLRRRVRGRLQAPASPTERPRRDAAGGALGDVATSASHSVALSRDPCAARPADCGEVSRAAAGEETGRCRSLLDSLLRPAWPDDSTRWADALVARFGSLPATLAARTSERAQITGPAAARFLGRVQDSLVHGLRVRVAERPVVSTSKQLVDYLKADMANLTNERFRVLFLTAQNALIADDLIWEGTVGEAPAYPREVVKRALEVGAVGLILVHNHPSGSHQPSDGDVDATRRILAAASSMGICVHDHIVISRAGWASFRSMGLLDPPREGAAA
jgi:DNA repair protein RadC